MTKLQSSTPTRLACAIVAALLLALSTTLAVAEDAPSHRWLREAGLNFGVGLRADGRTPYSIAAALPRVGLDLATGFEALGTGRIPGLFEFVIEPTAIYVNEPGPDFEAGLTLLFKYGWPMLGGRVIPFIEGGAGCEWMNEEVPWQRNGVNFTPQLGPGLHVMLTKSWAATIAYRYRHLSNAYLGDPNSGVNAHFFVGGVSYFWKPEPATCP